MSILFPCIYICLCFNNNDYDDDDNDDDDGGGGGGGDDHWCMYIHTHTQKKTKEFYK